jgi:hypothetical protein
MGLSGGVVPEEAGRDDDAGGDKKMEKVSAENS